MSRFGRRVRGFAVVAFSVAAAPDARAQVEFDTYRSYEGGPFGVVLGDFDEDGLEDIGFSDYTNDTVGVLFATAPGSFRPVASFEADNRPRALAKTDVDGDGHLDLVVVNLGRPFLSVLVGDGRGTFTTDESSALPRQGYESIAVSDFDEDGTPDLAIAGSDPGLSILSGDGAGRFAPLAGSTDGRGRSLGLGDFDEDGHTDVALGSTGAALLYLGDGRGTISAPITVATGSGEIGLAAEDLDGDGHLDLAAARRGTSEVDVVFGDGAGRFAFPRAFASGPRSRNVTAADVDADGRVDLVVTLEGGYGRGNGGLAVLFADEAAGYGTPMILRVGTPFAVVASDLDRDGRVDLLTNDVAIVRGLGGRQFEQPRWTLGESRTASLVGGDFDDDGNGDVVLLDWNAASGSSSAVVHYAGDGSGNLARAAGQDLPFAPSQGLSVDFDGNGRVDIVTISLDPAAVVLLGDGAGGFTPGPPASIGATGIVGLDLGDFDGDGLVDAAATRGFASGIDVLSGDGARGFSGSVPLDTGGPTSSIAAVDFNEDGNDDLAALTAAGIILFRGRPGRGLEFDRLIAVEGAPSFLAAGDFDGDGHTDLYYVTYAPSGYLGRVARGDGRGAFEPFGVAPITRTATAVTDIDEDGRDDIVGRDRSSDIGVSVLIAPGFGSQAFPSAFGCGAPASSIEIIDMDNDGHLDVVAIASQLAPIEPVAIAVLLSRPDRFCRRGNVNAGHGQVTDVLFVNDSSGGPERRIALLVHEPLSVFMAAPPASAGSAPFALYVWGRDATGASARPLPYSLGYACLPMPLTEGTPQPRRTWNNTGDPRLGMPTFPSAPAPSIIVSRPGGIGRPVTFFLQGIIADPASAARVRASVTNGIAVTVR